MCIVGQYIVLEWYHELIDEPYKIYSEIDEFRYDVRKIEYYKNGTSIRYGGEINEKLLGLGEIAFPQNLDEINQNKQFWARYIEKEEFEKNGETIEFGISIGG